MAAQRVIDKIAGGLHKAVDAIGSAASTGAEEVVKTSGKLRFPTLLLAGAVAVSVGMLLAGIREGSLLLGGAIFSAGLIFAVWAPLAAVGIIFWYWWRHREHFKVTLAVAAGWFAYLSAIPIRGHLHTTSALLWLTVGALVLHPPSKERGSRFLYYGFISIIIIGMFSVAGVSVSGVRMPNLGVSDTVDRLMQALSGETSAHLWRQSYAAREGWIHVGELTEDPDLPRADARYCIADVAGNPCDFNKKTAYLHPAHRDGRHRGEEVTFTLALAPDGSVTGFKVLLSSGSAEADGALIAWYSANRWGLMPDGEEPGRAVKVTRTIEWGE